MASLRNKRKLAAVTRETRGEPPRNGQSRNTSVPSLTRNISHRFLTQNIPEHKRGKIGNEWRRLPEWSSSWSRHFAQPDYTKFWPRCWPWHSDRSSDRESIWLRHGDKSSRRNSISYSHGDKNSRRHSLLHPWDFFRKTKEGALHKSATIPQWEHPCDIRSTHEFFGPSAVGEHYQLRQHQQHHY